MIKKIKSLKNIRNFINFNCEETFVKNNVIYAFNGTGKTNFSRFFACFQSEKVNIQEIEKFISLEAIENKAKIDFNIEFDNNVLVNPSNLELPVNQTFFVFNDDFISQHIGIQNFSINKKHSGEIIIGKIGADAIKIENYEKQLLLLINNIKEEQKKIDDLLSERYKSFLKSFKAKDSQYYRTIFSKEKYNEGSFLKAIKDKYSNYNPVENLNKIDSIDEFANIKLSFKSIDNTIDFTELEKTIHKSFKFDDIKEDVEKHIQKVSKNWIELGLLHHQDEVCPFCLQTTKGLSIIKAYDDYIKSEKSLLLTKLNDFKTKIKSIVSIVESNKQIFDSGLKDKVVSLASTLGLSKNYIDLPAILSIKEELEFILLMIEAKELYIEDSYLEDKKYIKQFNESILTFVNSYNDILKQNNQLISLVNQKLLSTGDRKTELRKEISEFELLNVWNSSLAIRKDLSKYQNEFKETENQLNIERSKSVRKEKKELIIELQNKLLKKVGLTKYKIDTDFSLKLKTLKEFNISNQTGIVSQGEKTVIAFTYYIAQVIQRINNYDDIENSIFVIDDPVSSTSYNYLHGISAIIKDLSNIYKQVFDVKTNNNKNPQIIITTHNIQFYNILESNVFLNDCTYFNLSKYSDKIQLNRVTNHKKLSEYLTSLNRVKLFSEGKIDDNIAMDLRKVLETICSFYYPGSKLSKVNLDKIFEKEIPFNLKLIADDFIHSDFNNHEEPYDSDTLKIATNELLILLNEKFEGQLAYMEHLN